jgi:hypothetical protein
MKIKKDIDSAILSLVKYVTKYELIVKNYSENNFDWDKNFTNYMSTIEIIVQFLCEKLIEDNYDFNFQFSNTSPFYEIKKIAGLKYISLKLGITVEEFKKLEHAHREFCHQPDIKDKNFKFFENSLDRHHFLTSLLGKFFNCSVIIDQICNNIGIDYNVYVSKSSELDTINDIKNIELSFREFVIIFFGEEKIKTYDNLKKMYKYDYIKFWEKKSGKTNSILNGTTFHELKNIFLDKRNFKKYGDLMDFKNSNDEKYFINYKRFICYILDDVLIASNKIRHWNPITKTQIEAMKFYSYYLPMIFHKLNMGAYLRLYNSEIEKK